MTSTGSKRVCLYEEIFARSSQRSFPLRFIPCHRRARLDIILTIQVDGLSVIT
jgi:hypothetical protein